jgi:hypothetical protein
VFLLTNNSSTNHGSIHPLIPTQAEQRQALSNVDLCEDADRHVDLQLWERNKSSFRTKPRPLTLAYHQGSGYTTTIHASMHMHATSSIAFHLPQQMQARACTPGQGELGQGNLASASKPTLGRSVFFLYNRALWF